MHMREAGVFYPHEITEMLEELQRGDRSGECISEREERAAAIIRRMALGREGSPSGEFLAPTPAEPDTSG